MTRDEELRLKSVHSVDNAPVTPVAKAIRSEEGHPSRSVEADLLDERHLLARLAAVSLADERECADETLKRVILQRAISELTYHVESGKCGNRAFLSWLNSIAPDDLSRPHNSMVVWHATMLTMEKIRVLDEALDVLTDPDLYPRSQ